MTPLRSLTVGELSIRGEHAFRTIGLYPALKRMLVADDFRFRAPAEGSPHANDDARR